MTTPDPTTAAAPTADYAIVKHSHSSKLLTVKVAGTIGLRQLVEDLHANPLYSAYSGVAVDIKYCSYTIAEKPRRYLVLQTMAAIPPGIKASDLKACASTTLAKFPQELQDAGCIIEEMEGHGRDDVSYLRLWFWLNRPTDSRELRDWLGYKPELQRHHFSPRLAYRRSNESNSKPLSIDARDGLPEVQVPEMPRPGTDSAPIFDDLDSALLVIKPPATSARCLEIAAAAYGAGGDEAYYSYVDWATRAGTYTEDECKKQWRASVKHPTGAGWTALREMAKADDPAWVPPSEIEELAFAAYGPGFERKYLNPWLPKIVLKPATITACVNDGEAALLESGLPVFQRDGEIVHTGVIADKDRYGANVSAQRLIRTNLTHMQEIFGQSAIWMEEKKRKFYPTDCPLGVARTYLAREGGGCRLPVMRGIINVPTILPDGSILDQEGYHKASGLYLDTRGVKYPKIPEKPTAQEVKAAHALLIDDLLSEFPFTDMATHDDGKKRPVGAISRAVALSALLTSVCRATLPTAPMHSVSANEAGTGKSYLVDIVSVLNTGYKAVPIDVSESNEEMDKRLGAALLAGQQFIVFGNVVRPLGGAMLNQFLTQERVSVRPLGLSKLVSVPCTQFCMADGNNLESVADMTRREVKCYMNAKMECPELRSFKKDPFALIEADRGKYIAAILTILTWISQTPGLLTGDLGVRLRISTIVSDRSGLRGRAPGAFARCESDGQQLPGMRVCRVVRLGSGAAGSCWPERPRGPFRQS